MDARGRAWRCMEVAMTHRNRGIGLRVIWMVLGVALFVFGQSRCENAWAQEELFVTNGNTDSITVYARTANGNTSPLRAIQGAATGLNGPRGLFVDTFNNELLVANDTNNSITVYSLSANGNTAPLRTLLGAATGLSLPARHQRPLRELTRLPLPPLPEH